MPNGDIEKFLNQYAEGNFARFHMPGHKGGLGFLRDQNNRTASWDITEISGADNLIMSDGIIKQAQEKAAKAFGANHTFFLTCGSTAGLLAALLSLPPKSTVLISRDCHKSIVSGCVLADINAVFMESPYDRKARRFGLLNANEIQTYLSKGRKPAALVVTRPDYWGRCMDLKPIEALCRRHNMLLIVDEAHGAHFSFSEQLPESASRYADIWVQSAHKTLAAWNQCAYLHMGANGSTYMPTKERLARALQLIHTTSPSYPMLAALEKASQTNAQEWTKHIDRIAKWKSDLPVFWQDRVQGRKQDQGAETVDPTRLVIETQEMGLTGYQLADYLRDKKIVVEMADQQCVVLITTPSDPDEWYQRLKDALKEVQVRDKNSSRIQIDHDIPTFACERVTSIREAALAEAERVPSARAAERICAQAAGIYPPGYALVIPGERISQKLLHYMRQNIAAGAEAFGWPPLCVKEQ